MACLGKNPGAMAPKKAKATDAPLAPTLDDLIIQRVEAALDRDGLTKGLADRVAARLLATFRIEDLAEQILERRRDALIIGLSARYLGNAAGPSSPPVSPERPLP